MTNAERIAQLEGYLAARTGKAGYTKNVQHIEREIARLRKLDGTKTFSA